MILTVTVALFVIYCSIQIFKPTLYWKTRGVPCEANWPLIGSMAPYIFRRKPFTYMVRDWYNKNKNKRYFGIVQFLTPTLVVNDPELIKDITVKHFDSFTDHFEFLPKTTDSFWSKNLFSMEGQDWKEMRSILSPVFTSSKMKMIFNLMVQCSQTFLSHLNSKDIIELEMRNEIRKYSNDVIASTAFGFQLDSVKDPDNEFYKVGRNAFDFEGIKGLKFFGESISPMLMKILNVKFFDDFTKNFFLTTISDVIKQREKTGYVRLDMVHMLREAQKERNLEQEKNLSNSSENGDRNKRQKSITCITDEDIAAQATVFFFGGFDTVSVLLCHLTLLLTLNPEAQQKLFEEVDEVYKNCNGQLTYDVILKMEYLDMVVSESLRMWSPAVFLNRKATKTFTIAPKNNDEVPLTVEAGTCIWIPVFGLHHDPKYYENPEVFDPERFNEANKNKIHPYTYLPFGIGPRMCIANRFALLEAKTIIFFLLNKFELVPVKRTPKTFKLSKKIVMAIYDEGFWVGLKAR